MEVSHKTDHSQEASEDLKTLLDSQFERRELEMREAHDRMLAAIRLNVAEQMTVLRTCRLDMHKLLSSPAGARPTWSSAAISWEVSVEQSTEPSVHPQDGKELQDAIRQAQSFRFVFDQDAPPSTASFDQVDQDSRVAQERELWHDHNQETLNWQALQSRREQPWSADPLYLEPLEAQTASKGARAFELREAIAGKAPRLSPAGQPVSPSKVSQQDSIGNSSCTSGRSSKRYAGSNASDRPRRKSKRSSSALDADRGDATTEQPPGLWRRYQKFVAGDNFEVLSGILISAYCVFISAHMQFLGIGVGRALLDTDPVTAVNALPRTPIGGWWYGEWAFTVLFIVELVMRVAAQPLLFWSRGWNLFDLAIVGLGLLTTFPDAHLPFDPLMLRLLRFIKLGRCMLRVFRLFSFINSLQLLVKSITACYSALFWSMVLLFGLKSMAALFLMQLLQDFFKDVNEPLALRLEVYNLSGTFSKAMLTMFEVTHVNYSHVARTIGQIDETFSWFFVLYRVTVSFAVLNIIRAVFIQRTLAVSQTDRDLMIFNTGTSEKFYTSEFRDVFTEMVGTSEVLNKEQFERGLQRKSIRLWLQALGLSIHDADIVFRMMDQDQDRSLSCDEFVSTLLIMKGPATALDLFSRSTQVTKDVSEVVRQLSDPMSPRHVRSRTSSMTDMTEKRTERRLY